MRRVVALMVLVLGVIAAGTLPSRAAIIGSGVFYTPRPICATKQPYATPLPPPPYSLAGCDASPTPERPLVLPTKLMSVGAGVPGPDGTTAYTITIVSSLACFSLNEPIFLYAMGDAGSAVLRQVSPEPAQLGQPQVIPVNVDPLTNSATVSLEIRNSMIGPGGFNVKAVWPEESLERIINLIPPAPTPVPTATATELPYAIATSTPTITPVPTATATATPTTTGTPPATSTPPPPPTATPDIRPLTARACFLPSTVSSQSSTTLYVQTLPGATCIARVRYLDGERPKVLEFDGSAQVAASDGFTIFPLTVNVSIGAGGATADVICRRGSTQVATSAHLTITAG